MKSLSESPAVLTVHQGSAGQYILRVSDLRHRPLVIGVSKLLPDATSLVVITPTDTKVFTVGNGIPATETAATIEEVEPEIDDPELRAAIARESAHVPPGVSAEDDTEVVPPAGAEVVGETSQGTKVIRRKKSPAPTAGHNEACGRCTGSGHIQVLMDGGSPAQTTCPICKGSGQMIRYGVRR